MFEMCARTLFRNRPLFIFKEPLPEVEAGTGEGEHDVERLGVQSIAGGRGQLVREVVDEHDLAGQGALDPVSDRRRLAECVRGTARQRAHVDLCLHLPLRSGLRAGNRRRAEGAADRRKRSGIAQPALGASHRAR